MMWLPIFFIATNNVQHFILVTLEPEDSTRLFLRLELAVRDHVVVLVRGVDVFLHGSRGVHLDHLEASAQGEGESRGGVADSEELAWLERRLLSWNAKRRRPARTSVAGWSPRRRRRLRQHRAGT